MAEIQTSKHAQSVLVLTIHKTNKGYILCVIPKAIRDPRPDFAGYEQSRNYAWGWNPVGDGQNNYGLSKSSSLKMISGVGSVTVTT